MEKKRKSGNRPTYMQSIDFYKSMKAINLG